MRTVLNIKGVSAGVWMPSNGRWLGVSGISQMGSPITSEMEFGIGSHTKLFTGVLLLKLAENNLLALDDSLHSYLPSIPNIDSNITIRQLLNHTSGLEDVSNTPGYPDSILNDPNRFYTASELMTWLGPPMFSAGSSWAYCNTNYLLAGIIAESVTGRSYQNLLRDSILNPLQLDSTFLDAYDTVLNSIAHPWQAGVDNYFIPRRALNSAAWSAGGMYSTAPEMLQWYQALMNGQVLKPTSFSEMTKFVGSGNYGIGISRAVVNGRTVWQHGGNIWGGYNTFMIYDSTSGNIITVLTNQLPAQAMLIAAELHQSLLDHPLNIPQSDKPDDGISLYPNPSNSFVKIELPNQKILRFNCYHPSGTQVKSGNGNYLDLTDLLSGTYFIEVFTDQGRFREKLVKW